MEHNIQEDDTSPRDPARVARFRMAVMLPLIIGLVPSFLLGNSVGGETVAFIAAGLYCIPALIAVAWVFRSAPVDNYLRIGAGEDGWIGLAMATSVVGQAAVIAAGNGTFDPAAGSDRVEA